MMALQSQFYYINCCITSVPMPSPGGIPLDGTPLQMLRQINQILFITYTILASVGILFAILCLLFIIIFRKKK